MTISPWKKPRSAQSRPNRRQLRLELLEDRSLLSTFTVLNTNDSGVGSLRQAILDANAAGGSNSIAFSIGSGAQTISPLTLLPALGSSITLDGSTQPGYNGTPLIAITGKTDGGNALTVAGNNDVVSNLKIEDYFIQNSSNPSPTALTVTGNNNVVSGNVIVPDPASTIRGFGIYITGSNNTIGGTTPSARNMIVGFVTNDFAGLSGIYVSGGSGNTIEGNYIGIDPTGTKAMPNENGVWVTNAQNTTIGGSTPGAGNLISGNDTNGVLIQNSAQCIISGNLIGTDVTGTFALPNAAVISGYAVAIQNSLNCTIGGTSPSARNVISGNETGIQIFSSSQSAVADVVEGNFIGTRIDGQHPLQSALYPPAAPYQTDGIILDSTGNTVINNVIAFNGNGIFGGGRVSQNSMFDNVQHGLSAGIVPPTPTIISATESGNQTVITGGLMGTGINSFEPNTTYTLEFFSALDRDYAGLLEGRTFLGSMSVTTDSNDTASFTFTGPASSAPFFTATATDPAGNTSSFWQSAIPAPSISGVSVLDVTLAPGPHPGEIVAPVTLSVTGTNLYTSIIPFFPFFPALNGLGIPIRTLVGPTTLQLTFDFPNTGGTGSLSLGNGPNPSQDQSNSVTVSVSQADVFVAGLYKHLLGRSVEAAGMQAWAGLLNGGASPSQITADIEASAEYRTDQVQAIYQQYLHRAADPAGLAAFVSFLQHGGTVEQLIAGVIGSGEYYQNRGGGAHDGFLSDFYQDALNRQIDSGGQAHWDQAFANGATTYQIAGVILTSQEYRQDLISSWYVKYLDRQPDSAGLNGWLMQVEQGVRDEAIIAAILGSAEYFNNPQP